MNELIGYYLKAISSSTLSLKKKGILIDKPWALVDNEGEMQKFIFKRDNGLILSKNGNVTEGTWEYFPEAKAILIDRGIDKILLKEQFIDDNVLVLKKDGTTNDFFALANENTIPNLDVPAYLNKLKCRKFDIKEIELFDGCSIQIYDVLDSEYLPYSTGHDVELINHDYNSIEINDGSYLSKNKNLTFYIQDKKIFSIQKNSLKRLADNSTIEIENGNEESIDNINKLVSVNGKSISDGRLTDDKNIIYEIKNSKISQIYLPRKYQLKNGEEVVIEQTSYYKIKRGNKIIKLNSITPIEDGIYKIKGKWKKIKVVNSFIV